VALGPGLRPKGWHALAAAVSIGLLVAAPTAAARLRLPPPRALLPRHNPPPLSVQLSLRRAGPAVPTAPFALVFVYHQVSPADWPLRGGPDFVTPQRLASDFAFFRRRGVTTLTAPQFLAYMQGRATVPYGSVFLTFDNGLEGVYRYAFPLALRYHIHFTVFIIGDRTVERPFPRDRFLTWPQLRRMIASGLVNVESESYDLHFKHPIARNRHGPGVLRAWLPARRRYEPLTDYLDRISAGFMDQRRLFLAHLHYAPDLLVWPFSTYNQVALAAARRAGYKAAFVVGPGYALPGGPMYVIPRNAATFMRDHVQQEYVSLVAGFWRRAAGAPPGRPISD
jgi:peptidoglycan/xylan/chitin deacetylase (PgdA/CDA1 family)